MKQILLSLILITYIAAIDLEKNYGKEFHDEESYDRVKPFFSIDYNSIAIDDLGDDKVNALNLSAGWVYKKNNKFNISYFNGKKDIDQYSYMRVNNYNLVYEYSFNNFGLQRGFYLGAGIARNNFKTTQLPNLSLLDNNDTNTTIDTNATDSGSFQLDLLFRAGYEHRLNDNYIVDLSLNSSIVPIGSRKDFKRVYYARFSIKYLFDIP